MADPVNPAHVIADMEARREDLIALTAALVAAPSANPPGSTSAPARVLSTYLSARGVKHELAAAVPDKPNVVATVQGARSGPHVVLCGHLDTILPGDPTDWSVDLHALTPRGPDLLGLGVGNMKGGLAALAVALSWLHDCRDAWGGRVSLVAVADETVFGPHGAEWLLSTRPGLRGDALICGEGPGGMGLAVAEKGVLWIELTASAPAGQGMLTTPGASATVRLAQALLALDALGRLQATPPAGLECLARHAGAHGLRLSVNIGTLRGGSFVSQRPGVAVAEVDLRVPPGLTLTAIEARVDAACAGISGVSWRRIKGWEASWSDPTSLVPMRVSHAAAQVRGTAPPLVVRLPGSDASRWRALGVSAVCYGPQPTLAAGPDDFVRTQDLVDCAKVYALATRECLTQ